MEDPTPPPVPRWKLTARLYWRWLVGGPNLVRALGSEVLAAVRKRADAEKSAREDPVEFEREPGAQA